MNGTNLPRLTDPIPDPVLILDIETISARSRDKFTFTGEAGEEKLESSLDEFAALSPLLGRVWLIGVREVRIGPDKIFSCDGSDDGERQMLISFAGYINEQYGSNLRKKRLWWAGHNVASFDIPFLKNRSFRLNCEDHVCPLFPGTGWASKPWEGNVMDTYKMWKSVSPHQPPVGKVRGFSSLQNICAQLGIPVQEGPLGGEMEKCFSQGSEGLKLAKEHLQMDLIQEDLVFRRLYFHSQ